jgi:hypothetical protein
MGKGVRSGGGGPPGLTFPFFGHATRRSPQSLEWQAVSGAVPPQLVREELAASTATIEEALDKCDDYGLAQTKGLLLCEGWLAPG